MVPAAGTFQELRAFCREWQGSYELSFLDWTPLAYFSVPNQCTMKLQLQDNK
jgi:hypothetical protein